MPNRPMTRQMGRGIVYLLVIGMFVQLGLLAYVYASARSARQNLITSQRRGCERGKLDRVDNAAFQRAQATYITKVTGADSVKEDVKRAAREAKKTFDRTSASLTRRAKIDCKKAYP